MRLLDKHDRRDCFTDEYRLVALTRKIMPSFFKKLFGGKKNGSRSSHPQRGDIDQNEDMYTAILASKSQKRFANEIMDALQRTGEVIVDGKRDVAPSYGDAISNARQTVQYMHQSRVTAMVILSSDELTSFFNGSNNVQLQVTGEDINLDVGVISSSFSSDRKIREKVLVVVLPGISATFPNVLNGVDVLHLGTDKRIWNKEIVGKFMQKITLRH